MRSTEATMMFLDCPAHLDQDGALRCGLPAEVKCRFTMHSTDGPVDSAMITCPAGHRFCGAIEDLTPGGQEKRDPDRFSVRQSPRPAERRHGRPDAAPAYYLGHPAALWIAVMRPRRRPAAAR
jgi:hypothetical protein